MLEITNARIPGCQGWQRIWTDGQGVIRGICPMDGPDTKQANSMDVSTGLAGAFTLLDVAGDWLSIGGVDLQINGALGLAFPDLELHHLPVLQDICQFLFRQGIDGFLPTLVTTSVEKIQRSLATIAAFVQSHEVKRQETTAPPLAQILGVHLEGPCLNPEKRGAHPTEYLLPLTIDRMKAVLGEYGDIVKLVTLAPELDPAGTVIPYLRSRNIIVSLGHSQATAAQSQHAFRLGASMVTHAFNAMPGIHHRDPGLLGAAIVHPGICCGLIADGQHVCPTAIDILLRASQGKFSQHPNNSSDRQWNVFLVSDALAPLGLSDGTYPWDRRQIEVKHGTARLPDGTLAGTTVPLLAGVQNLVRWGICQPETAIALATEAPRIALNPNQHTEKNNTNSNPMEQFYIGQPANHLLRWHQQEDILTWQRLYRE